MAAPLNANVRETILQAAAQLLRQTSFDNITLAQIAATARISKGTLYYYYSSKDDILFDVAERYLSSLLEELLQWVDNKQKDTSLPRLFGFVLERGADDAFGNLRLYLIGASVSGQDALRQKYIELYAQFQQTLATRLAQRAPGAESGYLAWLILLLADGLLVQRQLDNPVFRDEAFSRRLAATLAQLAEGDGGTEK